MNRPQRMRRALGCMLLVISVGLSMQSASSQSVADTAAITTGTGTGPGSLNGMWVTFAYKGSARYSPAERVIRTADGKWPPLQPWAAKLLDERIKMTTEKGKPFETTLMQCLPGGVPEMVFGSPYPSQIIESPGQVTILYEMFNHYRVIYLDQKHPEDLDPSFMGDSVGHWEGDTLVVDTTGLTDKTSLDEVGVPHSDALHVIERYRRVDKETLEIVITIDDPKVFTQKWDAKIINKATRPGARFIEYICENNRSAEEYRNSPSGT